MDKTWLDLFITFFKIGLFTFGGGYAMLPLLQRECVEKKKWVTEQDITEYYAIGQTTPGIIAVNTATFIGYKQKGFLGAVVTTTGLVLPGILIILLLVNLVVRFSEIAMVKNMMNAIRVAVVVLILEALIRLYKGTLVNRESKFLYLGVLASGIFFPRMSPIVAVVVAGLVGGILYFRKKGQI